MYVSMYATLYIEQKCLLPRAVIVIMQFTVYLET